MKELRILIVAHEFSPEQGSECAEGWNLVTRLAKHHKVTVLYASGSQFRQQAYKTAINNYLKKNQSIENLEFVNIAQPKITKFIAYFNSYFLKISAIGLPFLYFIAYKFWQKAAYKKAKHLNKINKFNIVHQLTQITFREPGYLWKLDVPFVWGPTGGTSTLPKEYKKSLSLKSKLFENFRTFSNFFQFNFTNRVIKANKKASLIYTFSKEDATRFEKRAKGHIKLMPDAGTYKQTEDTSHIEEGQSTITGIWVGQLIERKAPEILLKALELNNIAKEKLKFIIIGSGPLETSLHKLATDMKLENIKWIKKVTHDEIFAIMRKADFLVHTSYREAATNIIPEAISMGLPIICHDISGMSIVVNDSCGIKIPLISPTKSIKKFSNAITQLYGNKTMLAELKNGARLRSEELSWDKMAETIANDYIQIHKKHLK